MGKIKEFINGFRKINYEVELAKKPSQFLLPISSIESIAKAADNLPVLNLNFRILDVDIHMGSPLYYMAENRGKKVFKKRREKVRTSDLHKAADDDKNKTDYFVKLSKTKYSKKSIRHTEYVVESTAVFRAVDNNMWTFTASVLITCGTFNDVFDDKITDIGIAVANGLITTMGINKMSWKSFGILIPNIFSIREKNSTYTEGLVRTYETCGHPYSLGRVIPDYIHNEATLSFDNIFTAILVDDEDGKDGIYKVIRKDR